MTRPQPKCTTLKALALSMLLAMAACTGVRSLPAPGAEQSLLATPVGYQNVRFNTLEANARIEEAVAEIRDQVAARIAREGEVPNGGRFDVLVLSGGGPDGAFGAGLLNGWSQRGGRPEFGLVTGISTGALIAPFAFLGSEFDPALKRFYTQTRTNDLVSFAILGGLFGAAGLTDTTPIRGILKREITPEFVRRLAEEHGKGRRLWVGTTNLDAQRAVIWDVGAIAATDRSDAPQLIRDVLLASASIPGAFPPVIFQVDAEGERFSEMHVDGGVTRQLFLFPFDAPAGRNREDPDALVRPGTVYAIRNSKLGSEYAETPPGIFEIAQRSVSTLIKSGGINDIAVLRQQADESGFEVKVVAVPDSFDVPSEELFDINYMRALYDAGEDLVLEGDLWR